MRDLSRRRLLALAAALPTPFVLRPAAARPAFAQAEAPAAAAWPDRSLRMIVPVAPGGSLDILGRTAARALTGPLGQPVVVENHTGAGSNIAFELVARARPDGLTLLVGSDPLTINPSLYAKIGYDPVRDFAAIAELVRAPQVLVVRTGLEARSLGEYRRLAQETAGATTLASQGIWAASCWARRWASRPPMCPIAAAGPPWLTWWPGISTACSSPCPPPSNTSARAASGPWP
jgi:tripartite-type tricarboxylate transporter receptor subunit TctC